MTDIAHNIDISQSPIGLDQAKVQYIDQKYGHVQYYVEVSQELFQHNRGKELFIWLGRAIGTVIPNFETSALHPDISPEKISEYLNHLGEAIYLFCHLAIMLDDPIEKASNDDDYKFVETLYSEIEKHFKDLCNQTDTQIQNCEIKKPEDIGNKPEDIANKRENYIKATKYWADCMFEKLSKLPNFGNVEIRAALLKAFQEILSSSRFSHAYDTYLQNGTLKDIEKHAPDIDTYVAKAKGGMGTQCMIPMGAMLLNDRLASELLKIAPLIDAAGRWGNDMATIPEELLGKTSNGILHTALLEKALTLEDIRSVTQQNINALLEKFLYQNSPVVKKTTGDWEKRVRDIHKMAQSLPPEINAVSFVEGLLWFLAQELQFCDPSIQKIWIDGLQKNYQEKIIQCLAILNPAKRFQAYEI